MDCELGFYNLDLSTGKRKKDLVHYSKTLRGIRAIECLRSRFFCWTGLKKVAIRMFRKQAQKANYSDPMPMIGQKFGSGQLSPSGGYMLGQEPENATSIPPHTLLPHPVREKACLRTFRPR